MVRGRPGSVLCRFGDFMGDAMNEQLWDLVLAYGRACIDWANADLDEAQEKLDDMNATRKDLVSAIEATVPKEPK
jgi:hypothetical protein